MKDGLTTIQVDFDSVWAIFEVYE